MPRVGEEPLNLVRTVNLPGVEGRISHLAIDLWTDLLFVGAPDANAVEAIDLRKNVVVKSVRGFHEPRGMVVVPDAQQLAVANARSGVIQWVDTKDYRITRSTAVGVDADCVRYEAHARRVYAGYGSGAIAAIDVADGDVIGQVTFEGHPSSFLIERIGSRIFVDVPSAGHVVVVDRNVMNVVATWLVPGARSNTSMALDESNHRLFVGCRTPGNVMVYDASSGKNTSTIETGSVAALFYDNLSERLYVSGDGFLDVVHVPGRGAAGRLAHLTTAEGAETSLFVPEENRLYLAVPHQGAQRSAIRVYEPR